MATFDWSKAGFGLYTDVWLTQALPGADLTPLPGAHSPLAVSVHTPTSFTYSIPLLASLAIQGTGFTYTSNYAPKTGTINSGVGTWSDGHGLSGTFSFSGINLNLKAYNDANGNVSKLIALTADQLRGDDKLIGSAKVDKIHGYLGNDKIYGNAGADYLYGGNDNDTVNGGLGNDWVQGQAGNDWLDGGKSKDTLTGDAGKDYFMFTVAPIDSNVDTIADFKHLDDQIVFKASVFTGLGTSIVQSEFAANASGHDAHNANQHIIYDQSDRSLWYDADGKNGEAAHKIATFKVAPVGGLDWTDFQLG